MPRRLWERSTRPVGEKAENRKQTATSPALSPCGEGDGTRGQKTAGECRMQNAECRNEAQKWEGESRKETTALRDCGTSLSAGGEGRGEVAPAVSPPSSALRALPSGFRHAGYGARAAIFSFNGNKIMTTSGGGMLASDDAKLIEHARKLSQQARDPAPHYEHTEIGYNYRMSNILAAIGRGQLRVLDERVAAKRRIFERYQQLLGDLPGITFMPEATTGRCNRWLTVILINAAEFGATPEHVRQALDAENIESRPVWKPMHLQPVFRHCRVRGGTVSERLFKLGLCLPSGTAMTPSDIERAADVVRRYRVRRTTDH